MKKITKKELKTILEQHKLWLDSNEKEGKRADLTRANLRRADLYCADLTGADLSGANLAGANLAGADLTNVTLYRADLTYSNLRCANLFGANLSGVDLIDSELEYADLTNTILDEKEQCRKGIVLTEPMVGYKKSNEGKIITLEIPIGSKVFSINNKKRRANKAKVIDMQGETELSSRYNTDFKYHVGDEIDIIDFNDNYNAECSTGIHFFLTRDEAKNYLLN